MGFIQVSDSQWVNIDAITVIGASTSRLYYYIYIVDGSRTEICVPYDSEYAVNIERLLRANHFGKFTLENEK